MIKSQVAVIGAGSWGTAIASILAGKGIETVLWSYNASHAAELANDRENKKYLPGFTFPVNLSITSNLQTALKNCTTICMVVPSHGFRQVFNEIVPLLTDNSTIMSAVKGIEINTRKTMTQVMEDVLLQKRCNKKIDLAVLSGPSFAKEVAEKTPTAVTIGCKNLSVAKELQHLFVTDWFRVYASTDVIGLEISAALKNIVAIAAGICDGLGYGLNTRAALITRGLAEISRLGVALGADITTFGGLSGMGDLVLTCTGNLSRNRTVGLKLGEGKKLPQILDEMEMVAEGVKTTKSAYNLARNHNIDMPILEQMYEIIYNDKDCKTAVVDLLTRELKVE